MKKKLTEDDAENVALTKVREAYGDDVIPLTAPRIITPDTQAASVERRSARFFKERPDLLEAFRKHMATSTPFQRWSRSYIVHLRPADQLGLVNAEVNLATGEVSLSELIPRAKRE